MAAAWAHTEWEPEKSVSRYSWMSNAGANVSGHDKVQRCIPVLLIGSVILYMTALEAGEFPV